LNNGYIRIEHILARFGSNAPHYSRSMNLRGFPKADVNVQPESRPNRPGGVLDFGTLQADAEQQMAATI